MAATVAAAVEAEAEVPRRRSQETLGAALEMVVAEVTVKAAVVVAVVNHEEHELHLHTNSW